MSVDLPLWKLAVGNGCVPDLSKVEARQPFPIVGNAARPDLHPGATFAARPNGSAMLPMLQIYEHIDFGGHSEVTSLNWYYVGDWWNDKISSIVIYSGRWRFYMHWHYEGPHWDLGPGQYRWVEAVNIPNDTISSFQFIGW